jgi:hypothetical protein
MGSHDFRLDFKAHKVYFLSSAYNFTKKSSPKTLKFFITSLLPATRWNLFSRSKMKTNPSSAIQKEEPLT